MADRPKMQEVFKIGDMLRSCDYRDQGRKVVVVEIEDDRIRVQRVVHGSWAGRRTYLTWKSLGRWARV